jgi:hypothetical protein
MGRGSTQKEKERRAWSVVGIRVIEIWEIKWNIS